MGGITSAPARVIRNWNVENRAMRAIDKPNRPAPPRYPTEARLIKQRVQEARSTAGPGKERRDFGERIGKTM